MNYEHDANLHTRPSATSSQAKRESGLQKFVYEYQSLVIE